MVFFLKFFLKQEGEVVYLNGLRVAYVVLIVIDVLFVAFF